tara:strand:- start:1335 stop:1568 length:234 start_codon:yes stop_codon:yes gene_type:complete
MPYATEEERKTLNAMRDAKLKELRKGKGAGRPSKATKKYTRDELSAMRDALQKEVRKEMKVGRGRPKRAKTIMKEKK